MIVDGDINDKTAGLSYVHSIRGDAYLFSEGNYYEGSFYNWQLNGKGIKRTIEGNVYKGNFVNFLKDGEGVEEVGQCKYTGTFNKDKRDGKGVIMVNKEVYNVVYINGILDDKYKYIEQMIK